MLTEVKCRSDLNCTVQTLKYDAWLLYFVGVGTSCVIIGLLGVVLSVIGRKVPIWDFGTLQRPVLTNIECFHNWVLLAHLPMSLCNHELSVVWHPAVSSSLVTSSVDSPPSHRFDHRNFICCTYMHIYP